jgi:hypothetical protein
MDTGRVGLVLRRNPRSSLNTNPEQPLCSSSQGETDMTEMKEPVAQWHPDVMRALSEKSTQTSDDEFTATDFQHVAQLLRSTDEKVVRASMSNWYNAILGALDFAAEFEPKLTAAKADEVYASQLMLKFRATLSNIVDGCDDEGDRIYFGSTNAADQLREISEEIEDLEWSKILASSQEKPDLYATIRALRTGLGRANSLIDAMMTNDPSEPVSDAGHVALDAWKAEAEALRELART